MLCRLHEVCARRWAHARAAGVSRGVEAGGGRALRGRRELDKGPVAHGWPDQTWTLARIATLIGRRFHKSYTPQGVAALLHRHGWSQQVPARRAVERDEDAAAAWVRKVWPGAEEPGRAFLNDLRRGERRTQKFGHLLGF